MTKNGEIAQAHHEFTAFMGQQHLNGFVITRVRRIDGQPYEFPITATFAPTQAMAWRIARELVKQRFLDLADQRPDIRSMKSNGLAARKCKMTWGLDDGQG